MAYWSTAIVKTNIKITTWSIDLVLKSEKMNFLFSYFDSFVKRENLTSASRTQPFKFVISELRQFVLKLVSTIIYRQEVIYHDLTTLSTKHFLLS